MTRASDNTGYIYIMFNIVFRQYGDDVYKIGKAKDVAKRMNGYITSYIDPPEIKYISSHCDNCSLVETIIFHKLRTQRINPNREFFKEDINALIEVIEETIKLLDGSRIYHYKS